MATAGTSPGDAAGAKPRLVRVLPHWRIKPSPENEKLYRRISTSDPDIQELAASIEKYGLKEPIRVTRDGVIISGHRRYAACDYLGLEEIPCVVEPIWHGDPEFIVLLREAN